MDSTEDWDNEEYTGSLADTKVFTPSANILEAPAALEEPKPQEIPSAPSGQGVNLSLLQHEVGSNYETNARFVAHRHSAFLDGISTELTQSSDISMQQQSLIQQQQPQAQPQPQQQSQQQQQPQQTVLSLPTMQLSQQPSAISSGVLTAAQTQYLTQLTQQASENLKAAAQTFSSSISSQVS